MIRKTFSPSARSYVTKHSDVKYTNWRGLHMTCFHNSSRRQMVEREGERPPNMSVFLSTKEPRRRAPESRGAFQHRLGDGEHELLRNVLLTSRNTRDYTQNFQYLTGLHSNNMTRLCWETLSFEIWAWLYLLFFWVNNKIFFYSPRAQTCILF